MKTKIWAGHEFRLFSAVEPETNARGEFVEVMPQDGYYKSATTELNPHGEGPFCQIPVPGLPARPGVLVVSVDGRPAYVGSASKSLSEWWGGFAQIQPANCFVGGQSTHCKVNNGVLCVARDGKAIALWIHETEDPDPVKRALIAKYEPIWND